MSEKRIEKKVSVIMSCYNTPNDMLCLAIESILNQTYKNIELITVNNGGNNLEQLKAYQVSDGRIVVINNPTTLELPESLNIAIAKSTGDYIARMDSDDYSLPSRIEKQVSYLEEHTDIGACGTFVKKFGSDTEFAIYPWINYKDVKATLFLFNEIFHPTVMIRRKAISNLQYRKGFNYSEDYEFWNRISKESKFSIVPFVGLCYRIHNKSASVTGKNMQVQSKRKVFVRNLKELDLSLDLLESMIALTEGEIEKIPDIKAFILTAQKINEVKRFYDVKSFNKVLNRAYFKLVISNKECIRKERMVDLIKLAFKSNVFGYTFTKIFFSIRSRIGFKHEFDIIPAEHRQFIN